MVAFLIMAASISVGINCTIEVQGANAEVHATLPEHGNLTFGLMPSETYHVHLHDMNGRLVCALRLRIPGSVRNGGMGGGSGPVVRPQARKSCHGGARLRGVRRAPAGACASGSGVSGRDVGDGLSSRRCERHGLPPNMAIRTANQSPKSPADSSSDSDDSDSGDSHMHDD